MMKKIQCLKCNKIINVKEIKKELTLNVNVDVFKSV